MSEAATELEFNELEAAKNVSRAATLGDRGVFCAVPLMGGSWMGATSNQPWGFEQRVPWIHRGPGTFKIDHIAQLPTLRRSDGMQCAALSLCRARS